MAELSALGVKLLPPVLVVALLNTNDGLVSASAFTWLLTLGKVDVVERITTTISTETSEQPLGGANRPAPLVKGAGPIHHLLLCAADALALLAVVCGRLGAHTLACDAVAVAIGLHASAATKAVLGAGLVLAGVALRGAFGVLHALTTNTAGGTQAAASEGLECACTGAVTLEVFAGVTLEAVAAGALAVLITILLVSLANATSVARVDAVAINKANKLALLIRGGALLVAAVCAVPAVVILVAGTLAAALQAGIIISGHADNFVILGDGLGATHVLTLVLRAVVGVHMAVNAHTLAGVASTLVHAAAWLAGWVADGTKSGAGAQFTCLTVEAVLARTEHLVLVQSTLVVFAAGHPRACALLSA